MAPTPILVVTSCTSRKRGSLALQRLVPELVGLSLAETAERWRSALARHPSRLPVRDMYIGRSFAEARQVAAHLGGSLYVVSAGLGLISADTSAPAYDLTPVGSGSALNAALAHANAGLVDWWEVLCAGHGLRSLLTAYPDALVLIALPMSYICMVRRELESLPAQASERVRIFTSTAGLVLLGDARKMCMPYDERLESWPAYAGTRADFPQRALRHFVEYLQAHVLPSDDARRAVSVAMEESHFRTVPMRRRLDDEQIRVLIRSQWDACAGSGARLLRYLRDDAKVSCEQGRFAQLRHDVAGERMAALGLMESAYVRLV